MVSGPPGIGMRRPDPSCSFSRSAEISNGRDAPSVVNRLATASRLEIIRRYFRREGFSESLVELLLAGNRTNTHSTYESAWRNWSDWCFSRNENPLSVPLVSILEFLSGLHRDGKSYSSVNIHRSMLSKTLPTVDGHPIGIHPLVKSLLNGCYNLNPPKPRYNYAWDPSVVINYMSKLGNNAFIPLPSLTKKTAVLLALASLLRVSELAAIDYQSVIFSEDDVKFTLLRIRKSQRGGPLQSVIIPKLLDANCCPVQALKAYVDRTSTIRESNIKQLFVSTIAPHAGVTANTMSKWIRSALNVSGVDTSIFKAHSTRGAAASKASASGISTDEILKAGHWKSESTFGRFYKRVIAPSIVPAVFRHDQV